MQVNILKVSGSWSSKKTVRICMFSCAQIDVCNKTDYSKFMYKYELSGKKYVSFSKKNMLLSSYQRIHNYDNLNSIKYRRILYFWGCIKRECWSIVSLKWNKGELWFCTLYFVLWNEGRVAWDEQWWCGHTHTHLVNPKYHRPNFSLIISFHLLLHI